MKTSKKKLVNSHKDTRKTVALGLCFKTFLIKEKTIPALYFNYKFYVSNKQKGVNKYIMKNQENMVIKIIEINFKANFL